MRRAHFLLENKTSEVPRRWVWFDTETDQIPLGDGGVTHVLRFGWAAYSERTARGTWTAPQWHRFTDVGTFWDWIEGHCYAKSRLTIACHNTSFDVPVLDAFGELARRGWTLRSAIIDAPPTICQWRKSTASLRLLDTLNYWRMPLKQLGEHVGTPKLDMPPDDADQAAWDRYAHQDVQVLVDATQQWVDRIIREDLGGCAPTLAGQAMRLFRHRHMHHKILIDSDEQALGLARAAYLGGRTECFRLGAYVDHFTLLDVNSMYPAVMRREQYPTMLRTYSTRMSTTRLRQWIERGCVVARVTLTSRTPRYALRLNGRVCFPVGTYQVVLTTPDIQAALDAGEVEQVHEAAYYDSAPIFRSFVDSLYAQRQHQIEAGDTTGAWITKILMNSLYGKFGQRGLVWESSGKAADLTAGARVVIDAQTGVVRRERQLGGLLQVLGTESESRDAHPAIAAHVTAYARALLWHYIEVAGPDQVYYCDTDSLLLTDTGLSRLGAQIDPLRLGALKVEGSYDQITIWGAKDYRFGDKARHKGVRSRATWLTGNTVRQDQWSSLKGILRAGRTTGPTTRPIEKTLKREYQKGIVGADGRVYPFVLGPAGTTGTLGAGGNG